MSGRIAPVLAELNAAVGALDPDRLDALSRRILGADRFSVKVGAAAPW